MIVFSRKQNESLIINDDIIVTVVDIRGDKVRLGVEAPKEIAVHRHEVYEAIRRNVRPLPPPAVAPTTNMRSERFPSAKRLTIADLEDRPPIAQSNAGPAPTATAGSGVTITSEVRSGRVPRWVHYLWSTLMPQETTEVSQPPAHASPVDEPQVPAQQMTAFEARMQKYDEQFAKIASQLDSMERRLASAAPKKANRSRPAKRKTSSSKTTKKVKRKKKPTKKKKKSRRRT